MSFIDVHLAEQLTVPQIAVATGISHTHLTRLFRARTGMTVIGYLRHRRIQRARDLLTHSTMSVPAVAASVGILDLHVFNKTCRAIAGASPRQLRTQGRA
jgi:transcriptional regulator GlxA family with amidase domain